MPEPIIQHVTDTAQWVAVYRAEESERSDALFKDPFAGRLAGDRGREIARQMSQSRHTNWSVVLRTCIVDRYIHQLLAEGVDLVLNLGAGLDARPYRMELPESLRWVEVDFPQMIEYKTPLLEAQRPRCRLERVSLDLSDRGARNRVLAEAVSGASNILVLTEGVIPYLSEQEVADLADDLRALPTVRHWILDYYTQRMERYISTRQRKKQMGNVRFKFFVPDWHGFFGSHGWKQRELRYYVDESIACGRPMPMPWWARILTALVPRDKMAEGARFAGYAVLERA